MKDRIIELLKSGDIELAQLGCIYLQNEAPREFWENYITSYLHPKFTWNITDEILIKCRQIGVWEQLETSYSAYYGIHDFSLKTLTDAIQVSKLLSYAQ